MLKNFFKIFRFGFVKVGFERYLCVFKKFR